MDTLIYLKNLLTDGYIASITPTSKFVVKRVCEKINFFESKLIVEYGPGTGIFTWSLLKEMTDQCSLIAVERNSNFCRFLKKNIRDPRLAVFHDSAENILDILKSRNGSSEPQADCILSGIPFSLLSRKTKMAILRNAYSALRPGGKFLAYQAFFQFPAHLKSPLKEIFQDVRARYVMPCLPPLLILEATKNI